MRFLIILIPYISDTQTSLHICVNNLKNIIKKNLNSVDPSPLASELTIFRRPQRLLVVSRKMATNCSMGKHEVSCVRGKLSKFCLRLLEFG